MKKLVLSLIACIICISMNAQSTVLNNPDNKAHFGVRVGAGLVCPSDVTSDGIGVSMFKTGLMTEIGAVYNFPVVANFYIEPGLMLNYYKYSLKDKFLEAFEESSVNSCTVNKFALSIPVMAGYRFDFAPDTRLYVFTGPEFSVGLSGKEKIKAKGIKVSENLYSENGGMNRFNMMWTFGAGIDFGSNFYFDLRGNIGMLNVLDNSDIKLRESLVTLRVGWNF